MDLPINNEPREKRAYKKARISATKWMSEIAPEHELNSEVVLLCGYEGCGKIYNDPVTLRRHYRVHAERRYVCHYDGCGKKFMDSTKLRRHICSHTGEKPYVCPNEGCGKAFALEFNLKIHSRTHLKENYYFCPECDKRYAYEYKLKSHILARHDRYAKKDPKMKTKPEAFPYPCPYKGCDKAYVYEYKLTLHLRRHHPLHLTRLDSDIDNGIDEGSDEVDVYPREQSKTQVSKIPSLKIVFRKGSTGEPANLDIGKQQMDCSNVHDCDGDSEETEEDHEDLDYSGRTTENEDDQETEDGE
ncbi:hypothetical protein IFM89_021403 [Coptis chinensis]|uniref:C2H2-type domain-containing protein n=1 Tax=Coptis chinensis TaxID=261450 RepID=A0A835IE98_9MAGN|nr:hypothetical protein IFM89_021403 [Coptis chinensis]